MKNASPSTPSRFKELADWQRLLTQSLSDRELLCLMKESGFWQVPRHNQQMARQHATLIDRILGFDLSRVEQNLIGKGKRVLPQGSFEYWGPALHAGAQTWVGLDPQTLNTPYAVLWRICELLELAAGQRVVDLGSAHGRLGVVMHFYCSGSYFLGLEYVGERVDEAKRLYQRWDCQHAQSQVQDLLAPGFVLPEADVYFIYDYGRHDHINATLGQISSQATERPIQLVARGQATKKLIADHHHWANLSYQGGGEEQFNIYQASPETMISLH